MNAAHDEALGTRGVASRLALSVLLAVALLGGVRKLTAERAADARAALLVERLEDVLNGMAFERVMPAVRVPSRDAPEEGDEPLHLHRVRRDGRTIAAVLKVVAPDGYSGPIELLVGVHADGSVTGVRVLSHRETPGLGDRIERRRSDWITGFDGRTLEPTKESSAARFDDLPDGASGWRDWRLTHTGDGDAFDALSGATITSRAVLDAVHRALVRFAAHREEVLAP